MDDVVLLARLQFALTILFHYIFPPITIGLGMVLVSLEGRHLLTGDAQYHHAARFWTRVYALTFALGVATGIVMEFQFGLTWATYSRFVGDVFGSALAAEGVFAFFLESGFLAVLVFGWDRVSRGMHFFATCMVALGSIFSSIWIVVANSWQQTPAGHHIVPVMRDGQPWVVDGQPMMRAEILDFWAVVFNPSSMIRLSHVLLGALVVGCFFATSIAAWYALRGKHPDFARRTFQGALPLSLIAVLGSAVTGHESALVVYEHQPAKLAAFEGHFRSGPGNLSLFGLPDPEEEDIDFDVAIPGGLSFLLFFDRDAPVIGLDRFRPEDRPPVAVPFVAYHLMVAFGLALIGLSALGIFFNLRGGLLRRRWLMWLFVLAVVPAVVANHAGWVSAEVGRQPWVVHPPLPRGPSGELLLDAQGHVRYDETRGLRTVNAVSPAVRASQVLSSIIGFSLIYALLGGVWLWLLNQKIQHGPEGFGPEAPTPEHHPWMDVGASRPQHGESMTDAKAAGAAPSPSRHRG